jgi:hypothetical protein
MIRMVDIHDVRFGLNSNTREDKEGKDKEREDRMRDKTQGEEHGTIPFR